MLKLCLLFALSMAAAFGQFAQPIQYVTADPTGSCIFGLPLQWNGTDKLLWGCGSDGAWHQSIAGGFTPGSVLFAGASGALAQDNANFFWDATNHRLGIGTTTPAYPLTIFTPSGGSYLSLNAHDGASQAAITFFVADVFQSQIGVQSNGDTFFFDNGHGRNFMNEAASSGQLQLQAAGGNISVGGTISTNYKVDVQSSGTSGTLRVFDQTPTTGVTYSLFQSGAGQGAQFLSDWQTNAGVRVAAIDTLGVSTFLSGTRKMEMAQNFFLQSSDSGLNWKSATDVTTGSVDTGLLRNAAGVLEIDNGTAGVYRDLILRNVTVNGTCTGCGNAPIASCSLTAATSCTITGAIAGAPVVARDASGNAVMPMSWTGLGTASVTCTFPAAFTGVCSTI